MVHRLPYTVPVPYMVPWFPAEKPICLFQTEQGEKKPKICRNSIYIRNQC